MRTPVIMFCVLAAVTSQAAEATKVSLVPFTIAGGQVVKCPCTDGGPLPAESGPYKVTGAGIMTVPDSSGKWLLLSFAFNLDVRQNARPTQIVVEDVSDDSPRLMVDDKNPAIERQSWKGSEEPTRIVKGSPPWLYKKGPTIKIFRFTIRAKNAPDIVLYQPAWFPLQTKAYFIRLAEKNG